MSEDLRQAYKLRFEGELEQEQYEICDFRQEADVTRRDALKALGGGLFFLVAVRAQDRVAPVRIQLADNGVVRAFTGKMEMGQGSRVILAQAVAEELHVGFEKVDLVMGDTDLCPDDGGTWASLTTPQTIPVIRQAAAAVYASRNGTPVSLRSPKDWRVLGSSIPKPTSRAIVTGRQIYPSDLRREGMLHASIVRSPHLKSTLQKADVSAAEQLSGVRIVRSENLLAALSQDMRTAASAARLIRAEWSPEPVPEIATWAEEFRKSAVEPVEQNQARYPPLLRLGNLDEGFAAGTRRLKSDYWLSPIAHVPMEPRAAIAEWKDGRVTIDCGVQAPFLVRQQVAKALSVPEDKVRIIVHDSGGGFGGKQNGECEIEAAILARGAGVPVRVAWSREEEFTQSYSRPAGLLEVESAIDSEGRFTAMRFANYNAGPAGIRPQYAIPHHWVGYYRTKSFVRQGSYRSLAAVANNFAREMHMEEWSARLKLDPVELRLRNIADARLREVIEKTAARFGWKSRKTAQGRAFGMSCNLEKDARLALFVEISTSPEVRVLRMAATGDFGAALNPDNLKNQMTGAILQGLGGALWEKLEFDAQRQKTRRLSQYRVPRFRDLPEMDIEVIDRREVDGAGAGESPITLTAPAIGAALFAATGKVPRSLPLLS